MAADVMELRDSMWRRELSETVGVVSVVSVVLVVLVHGVVVVVVVVVGDHGSTMMGTSRRCVVVIVVGGVGIGVPITQI